MCSFFYGFPDVNTFFVWVSLSMLYVFTLALAFHFFNYWDEKIMKVSVMCFIKYKKILSSFHVINSINRIQTLRSTERTVNPFFYPSQSCQNLGENEGRDIIAADGWG